MNENVKTFRCWKKNNENIYQFVYCKISICQSGSFILFKNGKLAIKDIWARSNKIRAVLLKRFPYYWVTGAYKNIYWVICLTLQKIIDDLHLTNKNINRRKILGVGCQLKVCGVVKIPDHIFRAKPTKLKKIIKLWKQEWFPSFMSLMETGNLSNFYFSFCCLKHVWKWNICDTEISSIGSICDTEISSIFFCRFWEGFPWAYALDTLLYISMIITRTVVSYQTLQRMTGS